MKTAGKIRLTYDIVFRRQAEADLWSLYRYIAERADKGRARDYIARIEKSCMALSTFPQRCTPRDDIAPGLRTLGFENRVTIAFRVVDQSVEIVAIAYAGREFESI